MQHPLNRREALRFLGVGATLALVAACGPITPASAPTGAVIPGARTTLRKVPAAGDSTTFVTFVVSISRSSWPRSTLPPSPTIHWTTVPSVIVIPQRGTVTASIFGISAYLLTIDVAALMTAVADGT